MGRHRHHVTLAVVSRAGSITPQRRASIDAGYPYASAASGTVAKRRPVPPETEEALRNTHLAGWRKGLGTLCFPCCTARGAAPATGCDFLYVGSCLLYTSDA